MLQVAPVFRLNGPDATWQHTQRANLYYAALFFNGTMRADRAPDWTPRRAKASPAAGSERREAPVGAVEAAPLQEHRLGAISAGVLEKVSEKGRVGTAVAHVMAGVAVRPPAASAASPQAPTPPTPPEERPAKARADGARSGGAVEQPRGAAGAAHPPERNAPTTGFGGSGQQRLRFGGAPPRPSPKPVRVTDGKSFAAGIAACVSSPETPRPSKFSTVPEALRALSARLSGDDAAAAAREEPGRGAWDKTWRAILLERTGSMVELAELADDVREALAELWRGGELPDRAAALVCERRELQPGRVWVVCPACQFAPDGAKGCRKCHGKGELPQEELSPAPAPTTRKRRKRRDE